MDTTVDYSIIIPAYNEAQWLPETLSCLLGAMKTIDGNGELIVVDNNSTDGTARIAREHGAIVVFEPVNQISRARNSGARVARGSHLIFVDADTCVSPGLMQITVRLLGNGEACGGGALVSMGDGANRYARVGVRIWNAISQRTQLAAGCFIFCRRDAFNDVGGFSEKVYASEELWLSRRLKSWGARHRLPFIVITTEYAMTSARKTEWYSPLRLTLVMLLAILFPWAVRYRALCGFWYRRPGDRARRDEAV